LGDPAQLPPESTKYLSIFTVVGTASQKYDFENPVTAHLSDCLATIKEKV
jgi:hypothetical protein